MNLLLSEKARGNAYLASIMLASLVMRALIGLIRPELGLAETALIGLTTMLLAGPSLYRMFYDAPLIKPEKRLPYVALSACAAGMFLYFIALNG
jgi:hypothetical protein